MSLINKEDLMQTLGITDMDCEKCEWYSRTARMCKRGSDFEDACIAIDYAPEVLPEPKWIPCSKTTDIPDHEIMACDKYGEIMLGYLAYEDDQWICASDGCEMVDPIAWCEKPETYREEGEHG